MTKDVPRLPPRGASLPIDEVMGEILAALAAGVRPSVVIEAPPGAGKTTRVPPTLLESGLFQGRILVTEPRRVAAKLSALRVAFERGEQVGASVGYRVRFDEKISRDTRLIYMTEGMLLRELDANPGLVGVDAVVFDEVHERSADLDVALALAWSLSQRRTEPLALIAMSATLEAKEIARYLGDARVVRSEGRAYPVEMEFSAVDDQRPLEVRVRSAVKTALARDEGDVLVFLPGAREIRLTQEALEGLSGLAVLPLHGDQPVEEQTRVLERNGEGRRVILATNIAETSVTIPGVTTVVDSGLARVKRYDAWTGIDRLEVQEISQARSIQRAGRAGRTASGRAVRLYTRANYERRPAQDIPELLRSGLGDLVLRLRGFERSPEELPWLAAPSVEALRLATSELASVGALDSQGQLNSIGRRMLHTALPFRLARVFVEAETLGIRALGAIAVALLAERDPWVFARGRQEDVAGRLTGDSDLEDRLERLLEAKRERFAPAALRRLELSRANVEPICRAADQLLRGEGWPVECAVDDWQALTRALLTGFPDRIGRRRGRGQEIVLHAGTMARLAEGSIIGECDLLLGLIWDAPNPRGGSIKGQPVVRWAHKVDANLLLDVMGDRIEAREEFVWDAVRERVETASGLYLGVLALEESVQKARPGTEASRVLVRALEGKGPSIYDPDGRLERLRRRLRLAFRNCPRMFDDLSESVEALRPLLDDMRSFARNAIERAAVEVVSLEEILHLEWERLVLGDDFHQLSFRLDKACPDHVYLGGGRELRVQYEDDRSPWIASRLQDFFSMTSAPTVCEGRVTLVLELLAPNQRPVQVTQDLNGFWTNHYPTVRRELMRRYPKHLWPEDGRTAQPPTPGRIR